MTDAEAETMADRLLREAHAIGKAAGCYTEEQMVWQAEKRLDSPLDEQRTRATSNAYLGEVLWYSLQASLNRQHCPDRAIRCMFYWAKGMSYQQIADIPEIGCRDRETVSKDVHRAIDLLRNDSGLGLWEVLAEVFCLRIAAIKDMCR